MSIALHTMINNVIIATIILKVVANFAGDRKILIIPKAVVIK